MRNIFLTILGILLSEVISAQTLQWAVRPTSAQLESYGNLLKVRKNGKSGLMDRNNRNIIPTEYDSISPFRDGFALAMNIKGNQLKIEGVISEGDYELQPLTESVYATRYMWFSDGKMPVKGTGGWGYLGTDGNMTIPCQFQTAYPFSEGYASVMIDDKAYYIDRNMDYLSVEAGYGNLVFASTFSGDEAIVYSGNSYSPKGYVINRRGRILRSYKVKPADLKINKEDHSIGDKAQLFNNQVQQLQQNSRYTVYEENGLYGYKMDEEIILPAQLEKADPVRGNYATVRFKGQNGVLRVVEGKISAQLENNQVEVIGNESGKGFLQISLPQAFEDAAIRVRMVDEQGNEMTMVPNSMQGEHRTYSFQPVSVPSSSTTKNYNLELWSDNLLLWKNDYSINYNVKQPEKEENVAGIQPTTSASVPKMHIASLSLSAPKASSKRANPKNDFYVTVAVTNSGDQRGDAYVSLYVDGQHNGSKTISVRGHGTSNAIFAVSSVKKERFAKVKATLKNGKSSHEANIHFMPFY